MQPFIHEKYDGLQVKASTTPTVDDIIKNFMPFCFLQTWVTFRVITFAKHMRKQGNEQNHTTVVLKWYSKKGIEGIPR